MDVMDQQGCMEIAMLGSWLCVYISRQLISYDIACHLEAETGHKGL